MSQPSKSLVSHPSGPLQPSSSLLEPSSIDPSLPIGLPDPPQPHQHNNHNHIHHNIRLAAATVSRSRPAGYLLRALRAASYPLRGVWYFSTRRYYWPLFIGRLVPLSIVSLLVYVILFSIAFLPQYAFLAIFHGWGAWPNAIVLVLAEGLVIIQVRNPWRQHIRERRRRQLANIVCDRACLRASLWTSAASLFLMYDPHSLP